MHVDFRFNPEREMPSVVAPDAVLSAKFWDCRYRSLSALARLRNLQVLEIFDFPDLDLSVIGDLRGLTYLRIIHLPKVNDLAPLGGLSRLESLGLETLPSWDPSGKVQVVESLDPIGELRALRHIQLFGVRSRDKSTGAAGEMSEPRIRSVFEVPQVGNETFLWRDWLVGRMDSGAQLWCGLTRACSRRRYAVPSLTAFAQRG